MGPSTGLCAVEAPVDLGAARKHLQATRSINGSPPATVCSPPTNRQKIAPNRQMENILLKSDPSRQLGVTPKVRPLRSHRGAALLAGAPGRLIASAWAEVQLIVLNGMAACKRRCWPCQPETDRHVWLHSEPTLAPSLSALVLHATKQRVMSAQPKH
jgi:hypothetical protein